MKIVLIGFSLQNAAALSVLIVRDYPDCVVAEVERIFDADSDLCLPNLSPAQKQGKLLIIELDGVGIHTANQESIQRLHEFIGERIALLVVRSDSADSAKWRAMTMNRTNWFWVSSPYDKEMMTERLSKVVIAAQYLPDPVTVAANSSCSECTSDSDSLLHAILNAYFCTKQTKLWHDLLDILEAKTPQKIAIGSQIVYMNRAKNMALVKNIDKLMDYCQISQGIQYSSTLLKTELMSFHAFDKIANAEEQEYKKYTLNGLLWQMYDRLLPKTIEVADHSLKLKMRFMPNVSHDVHSEGVKAVIAACLVVPKSFTELADFGLLPKDELQRLFLLAILSGFADTEVLSASFEQTNEQDSNHQTDQNQSVKTAKKTGFFKRLLAKLGMVA